MVNRVFLQDCTSIGYCRSVRCWPSVRYFLIAFIALVSIPLSAERSPTELPSDQPAPLRFLMTFDDGPSGKTANNPTSEILNKLADNNVQKNIKAIFFVQTRSASAGGSPPGLELMRRQIREGHLLGFHTSTPRHVSHLSLSPEEFQRSLKEGISDIAQLAGKPPRLVRPPFWTYDARTFEGYHRQNLQMLLTDLSANDGKIKGVNWSWRKRSNLVKQLRRLREQWINGELKDIDGSTPVVVTFHDINPYTARNIEVYLNILVEAAHKLELPLAEKPFYDNREELERAALARTARDASSKPGFWRWLWR